VENGEISVTCEFCSANYRFAPEDVGAAQGKTAQDNTAQDDTAQDNTAQGGGTNGTRSPS
jgi:hypothetical protein